MHFVLQVTKILCKVWEKGSLVPTRYQARRKGMLLWPRTGRWEGLGTEVYVLSLFTDQATSEARDQSDGKQGGSEGLPARVTALCELLVFVKNLELTSNSHLAGKTDRPGSKWELVYGRSTDLVDQVNDKHVIWPWERLCRITLYLLKAK